MSWTAETEGRSRRAKPSGNLGIFVLVAALLAVVTTFSYLSGFVDPISHQ